MEKEELGLTGRSYVFGYSKNHTDYLTKYRIMNKMHEIDEMLETTSPWWAIYTRHQHEKVIAEILSTKGFEIFLPLYESVRRWKDRKKILSLPVFPCYVFVRGNVNRRLQVLTTPGVHTILYSGEKVATIPDHEIEAIRRAVNSSAQVEPHPFLRCGETVRVTRGSLEGVRGVLVRKKSLYRLILSVEMLAQSVAVEIDASDVEPAKSNHADWMIAQSETMPVGSLNGLSTRAVVQ